MSTKTASTFIRWGLLSTAHINRALIPPIRQSKRSKLVAVASRSQTKADSYAHEWNIPKAFGSYEALLADPEVDVIYNSLPNSLHTSWTIKAIEAGKHVLCEKPMSLSITELDQIAAAVHRTGKIVAEAFMYRHHPQTLKVSELINSGVIGELRLIRGTFSYKLLNPANPRLDSGLGGGSIWDVGCYPISYARFLVGDEPEEVFGWQMTNPPGIDLLFAGQMRFPNHVYAQFDSSFDVPFRVNIEVIGSEGLIVIPNPYKPGKNDKITLTRGDKSEVITIRGQELYIGEVVDMENAILHAQPTRISLADSRGNVAAICALLESARLGKPIRL
jgi:D-xylose 1-dehydrogenase (NADP+, D-xylono-1,5-lactone-forming)